MGGTPLEVLNLLKKNTGRYHEVGEIASDLVPASESEVEASLKALKREGKVEQGTWGDGRSVWGAVEAAK